MPERDLFAEFIANRGPPQQPEPVSRAEAEAYRDRLPEGMIRFWLEYGRGSYKNNYYWLCDPAPFDPVLAKLFAGDPEFHAEDITILSYCAFGYCSAWNRRGVTMLINFEQSEVSGQPPKNNIDPDTGRPFTPDFLVGSALDIGMYDDTEWYEMICEKIGVPERHEIFGYVPLLQLGGAMDDIDSIRRVDAAPHLDMIAQTTRFTVIELTDPEPDAMMGRLLPVRKIGPQPS